MKICVYDRFGSLNSQPVFQAFKDGVIANGDTLVSSYDEADVVVIWSILFTGRMAANKHIWNRASVDKKPIIVLEVGALQRDHTWKMGVGGINNDALWCEPYEENRADKLGLKIEESTSTKEFITICTQRPDSQQWVGMPSVKDWVIEQVEYVLNLEMNLPIVVRPHPRDKITDFSFLNGIQTTVNIYYDAPKIVEGTYDSFNHKEIFDRSAIVINHSSGPGVQAVLSGLDVIVGNASLAWPVALNNEKYKDKQEWLEELAHTEFTTDELATGEPWKNLKASVLYGKDLVRKPTVYFQP